MQKYLEQAKERENEGAAPDVRFKSEQEAIITRGIYFRYYYYGDRDVLEDTCRVMENLKDIVSEATTPRNRDVRTWVLRQCYTNFFNLLFIAVRLGKDSDSDAFSLLKSFRELLEEDKEVEDPHAALVARVGSIYLHAMSESERAEAIPTTLAEIKRATLRLPYEKNRLELFKNLICPELENSLGP